MRGSHRVLVQNRKVQYDFEVKRNITVIRGDSATGKTTLIDMIRQHDQEGEFSGVSIRCDKDCTVLTGLRWKENMEAIKDSIVFIDESDRFIVSDEFAAVVRDSDNYYVLVTRDNLANLPYSVEEVYGIHASGKFMDLKKTYNEFYRIYQDYEVEDSFQPDLIITEDSNSGFEFFLQLAANRELSCKTAGGKTGIYAAVLENRENSVLVVADGAAFGSEMNRMRELQRIGFKLVLYLPESFEWLILKSGLIDGSRIRMILEAPEEFIESREYFSWERFFTALLTTETRETYLQYTKKHLNDRFLQEREKQAILVAMRRVGELLTD